MRRVTGLLVSTLLVWASLSVAFRATPVIVAVRWAPQITDAQRDAGERRYALRNGERQDPSGAPTTWSYRLADPSTANIRALVQDPEVQDTGRIDRQLYRPVPELPWTQLLRTVRLIVASLILGPILYFCVPRLLVRARPARRHAVAFGTSMWLDVRAAMAMNAPRATAPRGAAVARVAAVFAALMITFVMTMLAGAAFAASATTIVMVYVAGYVVGALLVPPTDELSLVIARTVAGLMLTTVGFLLSLVLRFTWFVVPVTLLVVAIVINGVAAFRLPRPRITVRWDGIGATILLVIVLAPIGIEFFRMGVGQFPAVFYNADTPYSLEKVHSLVAARTFPPPSLSNLGVVRTYHYGVYAMAALISRASGLPPHQALFLVVLPLLAVGTVAAAVAAARRLAPAVPLCLAVPLLLITTPTLARSFSDGFGPRFWQAVTAGPFTLEWLNADYVQWGFLSNEAQNTDFPILAAIAGIAAAPAIGWRLAVFVIGSSVIFKTTTGVALVAGFMLAEAWQAIESREYRPPGPVLLAGAVFAVTFAAFYLASFDSDRNVQFYPFGHLREIVHDGRPVSPRGLAIDALWLFLPAFAVFTTRRARPGAWSAQFLLMAIGPLIVINMWHLVPGGEDWYQIPRTVPFMVHAFALSLAGRYWQVLVRARRVAFVLTSVIVIAPVVVAADAYSWRLLHRPESGHEFADNRAIAPALASIPVHGSIVVTNDLRYPADNFGRDDRQMQVPALFGHQAFSANFSYEPVEDRRPLQNLLQRPQWDERIVEAAHKYHWTHFLVRKDYVHPSPIPLKRIFENDTYVVYQFP